MTTLMATDDNIRKAAQIIKSGGLVSFPTETVYGLGADALNPIAAAKIFEAKERPFFDPLIVHVAEISMVRELAGEISPLAEKLMKKYWPGPLTLVLPKSGIVPDIITSGLETVAIRMPDHETALKLIRYSGKPIAAPSANRFSCLSPTDAKHVETQLGGRIDMILDGGSTAVGVESTIVKVEGDSIILLRPGGISVEEIESFTHAKIITNHDSGNTEAPGQLPFHYSPGKPLRIIDRIESVSEKKGYLFFKNGESPCRSENCRVLSPDGNLEEAAANLFSMLHELDTMDIDEIICEEVPCTGLGRAIMDRLGKASKKHSQA